MANGTNGVLGQLARIPKTRGHARGHAYHLYMVGMSVMAKMKKKRTAQVSATISITYTYCIRDNSALTAKEVFFNVGLTYDVQTRFLAVN